MKKVSNIFLVVLFSALLLLVGVKTMIPSMGKIVDILKQRDTVDTATVQLVESTLKDSLWGKSKFINLLGRVEKLQRKQLVGENQFYQDKDGMMHLCRQSGDFSSLVDSVDELSTVLKDRQIPLLLCQTAERASYGDKYSKLFDGSSLEYIEPLHERMKDKCFYLSYPDVFENAGMSKKDIFFQTDVHYTTEAEFTALKAIADVLKNEIGITLSEKENVLDKSQYEVIEKPFIGNLAYSVGKAYTGADSFELYYPKFESSLRLENPSQSLKKEGKFSDVCMNGYIENGYTDQWTYWVTDYLQYPSPFYMIENQKIGETNILVICDSMAFRTVSYLSLMCHSITILDPRSFGETTYLSNALKADFDAVIVIATSNLLDGIGDSNPNALDAEIISNTAPSIVNHTDSYNFDITVKNTGTRTWSENAQNRLCIWQDGVDWGYRIYLPDGVTVQPGEEYTFTLNGFVLPEAESTYLEFQMLQEGVCYFGEKQRADIRAE